MNSLATLLSVAVFIGVTTCMSLQENEDNDVNTLDIGCWWHWHHHCHYNYHVHFHELREVDEPTQTCDGLTCRMCANSDYVANIQNDVTVNFPFKGCLVVSKVGDGYNFQLEMGDRKFDSNPNEINGVGVMPCMHSKMNSAEAELCPELYNVNKDDGTLCARMKKSVRFGKTMLRHEVELGCMELP